MVLQFRHSTVTGSQGMPRKMKPSVKNDRMMNDRPTYRSRLISFESQNWHWLIFMATSFGGRIMPSPQVGSQGA